MAFNLGDEETNGMNEMNLIPLIDIMLVLMIIFLVTATVLNPTVPLELPKTVASNNSKSNEVIQISIDKNQKIFWDQESIDLGILQQRFEKESKKGKNPSIHLKADKNTKYDAVAKVLAIASETGLNQIAFVSE